jgi:5'-nucleotidase
VPDNRPRILVVNDDGVDAEGIIVLAERLTVLGDVTVVAPDGDRSGTSHSISTRHAVTASPRPDRLVPTYACSGTPADCVVLGVNELCGGMPSIVVSGINRGANMADDINYSGTVAAAVEAVVVGIPAVAVSLVASWPDRALVHHWETAADVACALVADTLRDPLPAGTYFNVNVPNLERGQLLGIRYTRQGRKTYADRLARKDGETGTSFYWLWAKARFGGGDDTDTAAVEDGYASVTPLRIDRTDEDVLRDRSLEGLATEVRERGA